MASLPSTNCGTHSYTLGLCATEMKAYEAWQERHRSRYLCKQRHSVVLTGTGIGHVVRVKRSCGISTDITHYDHW